MVSTSFLIVSKKLQTSLISPLERGARRAGCVLLLLLHTPKSPLQRGLIILSKVDGSCRSEPPRFRHFPYVEVCHSCGGRNPAVGRNPCGFDIFHLKLDIPTSLAQHLFVYNTPKSSLRGVRQLPVDVAISFQTAGVNRDHRSWPHLLCNHRYISGIQLKVRVNKNA